MEGPLENVVDGTLLHRAARVHHHHPVGEVGHHTDIVGDQDHRAGQPPLHVRQDFEHLGLNRGVERGGRLVGDQDRRFHGDRHGDHHPLAHPAGEFVRVPASPPGRVGYPHPVE